MLCARSLAIVVAPDCSREKNCCCSFFCFFFFFFSIESRKEKRIQNEYSSSPTRIRILSASSESREANTLTQSSTDWSERGKRIKCLFKIEECAAVCLAGVAAASTMPTGQLLETPHKTDLLVFLWQVRRLRWIEKHSTRERLVSNIQAPGQLLKFISGRTARLRARAERKAAKLILPLSAPLSLSLVNQSSVAGTRGGGGSGNSGQLNSCPL